MIKCPKCGKEISHLLNYESGSNCYRFSLTEGHVDYETIDFQPNGKANDYDCPKCHETLATSDGDAFRILKGLAKSTTEEENFEEFSEDAGEIKHKLSAFLTKWQTDYNLFHAERMNPYIFELLEKTHTDLNDLL